MIRDELRQRSAAPATRRARTRRLALGGLVALVLQPSWNCHAQDAWTASIGATTNYVFRGVSQTDGGAALQCGINYRSPAGWFAGAWGSNVKPYRAPSSAMELDLYGGYAWPLARDFRAQATFTRYLYLDDPRPVGYDYGEFALTVSYLDRFAATLSYQPDTVSYSRKGYVDGGRVLGYEVNGRWPLAGRLLVTGGAGYYDVHDSFGVGYWSGSAGLAFVTGHFSVDLQRFFSDATVTQLYGDASADGAWVVSAQLLF